MCAEECTECHHHDESAASAAESPAVEPLKERPEEEVTARLAQQDLEEQDVIAGTSSTLRPTGPF